MPARASELGPVPRPESAEALDAGNAAMTPASQMASAAGDGNEEPREGGSRRRRGRRGRGGERAERTASAPREANGQEAITGEASAVVSASLAEPPPAQTAAHPEAAPVVRNQASVRGPVEAPPAVHGEALAREREATPALPGDTSVPERIEAAAPVPGEASSLLRAAATPAIAHAAAFAASQTAPPAPAEATPISLGVMTPAGAGSAPSTFESRAAPPRHLAANGAGETSGGAQREAQPAPSTHVAPDTMQAGATVPRATVHVPTQADAAEPGHALPPDSNLVLVETRFPAPAVEEQPPAAARPRRARPPRVTVPEEPLQMVETHKQDNG